MVRAQQGVGGDAPEHEEEEHQDDGAALVEPPQAERAEARDKQPAGDEGEPAAREPAVPPTKFSA